MNTWQNVLDLLLKASEEGLTLGAIKADDMLAAIEKDIRDADYADYERRMGDDL